MCDWDGANKKGLFIVMEGLDGAGKTTQAHLLVERLKADRHDAVYLKEPTTGQWGMKIRKIAEQGRDHVTPDEELEYFIKDREEDARLNIIPALNSGKTVVMDRYIYSNAAYQGALGFDPEMIFARNNGFPKPDAVFFLEIPPDEGLKRVNTRGTANEGFEKIDYLKRVNSIFCGDHNGFLKMTRIDALKSENEIIEHIWRKVSQLLQGQSSR
jgi:dTMP kinase